MTTTAAPTVQAPADGPHLRRTDPRLPRIVGRTRAVGLAALVGLATLVTPGPAPVAAQPVPDHANPFYVACMRGVASTPDSLERWVDVCLERGEARRLRFDECMRSAPRSPDAFERRTATCQLRATSMAVAHRK